MPLSDTGWLAVGRVRRPHGIHGEILVEQVTDFPERMIAGLEVAVGENAPDRLVKVLQVRSHKGSWLLALEGVETREEADGWRGHWVFLPPQERDQLPPNYYYEHELTGCVCHRRDGGVLGEVVALASGPGGGLLTLATARGEVMVPFRSPLVVSVDLATSTIVLDPPAGLFDDDAL